MVSVTPVGKLLYEIIFKVKKSRSSEFELHCNDTLAVVESTQGMQSASFSRRKADDSENLHYRVEIIFDNQEAMEYYQKVIVPKLRESSKNFGDDAKVEERKVYEIFAYKSK